MIGETVSHYRVLSTLGRGGMGEVYLARDTELDRDVALKFLSTSIAADRDAFARFRREAKAAAGLRHPNIVTIHEIGEHAGRPFIAMEHVEGDGIDALISAGDIDSARAVAIAIDVCEGLEEAHRAGIVHRDLKPQNIRVDRGGRARILDFGLARTVDATTLTEAGTTVGTARYMSPEQARGERVDARSDIFSLGAMFYEMLTGRPPFDAGHPAAVAYAIQNETPQPLARYCRGDTGELERVVGKALAKDPGQRYQSAADMAADLRRIQSGSDVRPGAGPRRRTRWVIPAIVVVAVAAAALFVQQWFGSPAEAEPNTLAIMYFENVADRDDPRRLGEIATNLLITDLSESEFIHVLSSQRLYDILRLKGKEGVRAIDRETAGEVARHAGARQMLLGSILRTDPSLVITSQLVDVASGEVVGSQRITGESGEDVFALVDRLSRDVRDDLGLPRAARFEEDTPVASVTTSSEEAYRYYVAGLDASNRWFPERAVEAFRKAVEIDSTFAMAWLMLSRPANVMMETRPDSVTRYALSQAVRYSSQVGRKERHYIAAEQAEVDYDIPTAIAELQAIVDEFPDEKDAHFALGTLYRGYTAEMERSIDHFRRVIEIDPLHKEAYNTLAYRYADLRNFEKAIWAVNQYVELAPGEHNPYDSRGDIYARFGHVDSAMSSYRRAVEVNPAYYPSQTKLGGLYMLRGDYDRAARELQKIASSPSPHVRSLARMCLGLIPMHRGRMREAIEELAEAVAVDRREGVGDDWRCYAKLSMMARAHIKIGEVDAGLALFDSLESLAGNPTSIGDTRWRGFYAMTLARLGRLEDARAQYDRGEADVLELDASYIGAVYHSRAVMELVAGDVDSARRWAHRSLESGERVSNAARLVLALCDLAMGDARAAIGELEFQCASAAEGRMLRPVWAAETRYHLARACEAIGDTDEAARRYREFLHIWRDADPEIRLVVPDPRDPDDRPLDFARRRLEACTTGAVN